MSEAKPAVRCSRDVQSTCIIGWGIRQNRFEAFEVVCRAGGRILTCLRRGQHKYLREVATRMITCRILDEGFKVAVVGRL